METLTLNVPTVHCRSCKLTIEEAVEELNGVVDCDVDLDTKRVTIAYDPELIAIAAIAAAIGHAGYVVEH